MCSISAHGRQTETYGSKETGRLAIIAWGVSYFSEFTLCLLNALLGILLEQRYTDNPQTAS